MEGLVIDTLLKTVTQPTAPDGVLKTVTQPTELAWHGQVSKTIKDLQSDLELEKKENSILRKELCKLKEFFGYDTDQSADDIQDLKEECDKEEKQYRENDEEYDKECVKSDYISDLVIELGEKQFAASKLYNKMKKFYNSTTSIDKDTRKLFVVAFNNFKNTIDPEQMEDFFDVISDWIDIQQEIMHIDQKILMYDNEDE